MDTISQSGALIVKRGKKGSEIFWLVRSRNDANANQMFKMCTESRR